MKNIYKIIVCFLLFTTCKAQQTNNDIFTQYQNRFDEEASEEMNLLILNFNNIDSITTSHNRNIIKLKNKNSFLVMMYSYKGSDFNHIPDNRDSIYLYKNNVKMKINIVLSNNDIYGIHSYIDSIPFKTGEYLLGYTHRNKDVKKFKEKWFYSLIPENYFYNKQERKDFAKLQLYYINFFDKNKYFVWRKEDQ